MLCAGIDVSKPHLDLALASGTAKPTRLRFPNTPEGRQALLAALAHLRPTWVALEPTGAYHLPLLKLLAEKGLQVALVNPYHPGLPSAGPRGAPTDHDRQDRPPPRPLRPGLRGKPPGPTPYPGSPPGAQGPGGLPGDPGRAGQAILNQMEAAEWAGSEGSSPSSRGSWPA